MLGGKEPDRNWHWIYDVRLQELRDAKEQSIQGELARGCDTHLVSFSMLLFLLR